MNKIFIVLFLICFSGLIAQGIVVWDQETKLVAKDIIGERLELKHGSFEIEMIGLWRDVGRKIKGVSVVVYCNLNNIKSDVEHENISFEELNLRKKVDVQRYPIKILKEEDGIVKDFIYDWDKMKKSSFRTN